MIDSSRVRLRQLLVSGYDGLKRRLARRLGSTDTATEVLHETWLRLDGTAEIGEVRKPESYLYRMALNVAADRQRGDTRWASKAEIEALCRADDGELDPERVAAARSEIAALQRVLAELPPRRRAIAFAALVEEQSYRVISVRFGVPLRSVERELQRAVAHCSERLGRTIARRSGETRDVKSQSVRSGDESDNDE